ncbi:MAG: hypothetical protein GAK43_01305 [Stenotrophomonas maltophilia]|nr:MAG: hypothetical protein GAK43_01305 [Stenotrophomonas maltophilia]
MSEHENGTAEGDLRKLLEVMINTPVNQHVSQSGGQLRGAIEEQLDSLKSQLGRKLKEVTESQEAGQDLLEEHQRELRGLVRAQDAQSKQLSELSENQQSHHRQSLEQLQQVQRTLAQATQRSEQLPADVRGLLDPALKALAQTSSVLGQSLGQGFAEQHQARNERLGMLESQLRAFATTASDERQVLAGQQRSIRKLQYALIALAALNGIALFGAIGWALVHLAQ